MATSDNPAARLHDLLSAFEEYGDGSTIGGAWGEILEVDPGDVPRALTHVAILLAQIEMQVDQQDSPRLTGLYNRFHSSWENAIMTPGTSLADTIATVRDRGATAALGGLAVVLGTHSRVSSSVDDPAQVSSLRDEIQSSIDEVLASQDLAGPVRTLLLQRLHDILWSLDHLTVTGPDGVKAAAERLAGALLMEDPSAATEGVVKRVLGATRRVWWVFTNGPDVPEAIEGWSNMLGM